MKKVESGSGIEVPGVHLQMMRIICLEDDVLRIFGKNPHNRSEEMVRFR